MSRTRKIGNTEVPAIGYGAMGIGGNGYGPAGSDEERFKILDRLFEIGCRHWDTANIYGDSEELIGKWFERTGNRDKIFLATKFGYTPELLVRGEPEFVKDEVSKALKKLKTTYVDLLYQHRSAADTPIEVTVGAMVELVKEGKVKYIGLSEPAPSTIRRAHAVHPISAIQVEYSPLEVTLEKPSGVLDVARELEIPIVAYSPIARGLVTGRIKSPADYVERDFRRSPRFSAENFPRILEVLKVLQDVGAANNATSAQVCLAWLLAQGADIIPIPGSKQIEYIEENLDAVNVRLTADDIKRIRDAVDLAWNDLGGLSRYLTPTLMNLVGQETPPL